MLLRYPGNGTATLIKFKISTSLYALVHVHVGTDPFVSRSRLLPDRLPWEYHSFLLTVTGKACLIAVLGASQTKNIFWEEPEVPSSRTVWPCSCFVSTIYSIGYITASRRFSLRAVLAEPPCGLMLYFRYIGCALLRLIRQRVTIGALRLTPFAQAAVASQQSLGWSLADDGEIIVEFSSALERDSWSTVEDLVLLTSDERYRQYSEGCESWSSQLTATVGRIAKSEKNHTCRCIGSCVWGFDATARGRCQTCA